MIDDGFGFYPDYVMYRTCRTRSKRSVTRSYQCALLRMEMSVNVGDGEVEPIGGQLLPQKPKDIRYRDG